MNHPVKRYKPNSDSKLNPNRHRRDLYDGQVHATSAVTAGAVQNGNDSASTSSAMSPGGGIGGSGSVGDQHIKTEPLTGDELPLSGDIKKEPADGDDSKVLTESLYTSKGLQASYNDLEQLFDENSDESPGGGVSYCHLYFLVGLLITYRCIFQLGQTPPRSNNSFGGHDDSRRYISSGLNNQQMNLMELTKMFPTPPSLEQHHPSSSPCGAGGPSDHQLDVIDSPHTASFSEEEIEVSQGNM